MSVNNNLGFRRWIKYLRFMIEVIRYKLKYMVQRKFDLCYSYIIVKWRRNELKIVCNMLRFRQGFTRNKNIGEL